MKTSFCVLVSGMTCLALNSALSQGDLAPTASPAPSMLRLDQIEARTPISSLPFTISSRGAYYLTKNLNGLAGTNGISIEANDVLIDLNGFTLRGGTGTLSGIRVNTTTYNITIRNGVIRKWGDDGISAFLGRNCRVEHIMAFTNGWESGSGIGIHLGTSGIIDQCQTFKNADDGISLLSGTVQNCTSRENGGDGINVSQGTMVKNNSVELNTGHGLHMGTGSTALENNSYKNGFNGVGHGIRVSGRGNRIEGNNVAENDIGIEVAIGNNIIIRNSAYNNATNYTISAGNASGQILSPGTGFVNTDPTANFTF